MGSQTLSKPLNLYLSAHLEQSEKDVHIKQLVMQGEQIYPALKVP